TATVSYYGGDSAQSGAITHNQTTWVETSVTGPGILRFYWKVSSEANFDFLQFSINGFEQTKISGTTNWHEKIYSIPEGSHTLRWEYTKDGSYSSGSDAGWLDKVEFIKTTTILSEAFEQWPPTGWNIKNNGGSCVWESSATLGYIYLTGGTGNAAVADSDACGSSMNTELRTFSLNLSNTTMAFLEFKSDFWSYSNYDDGYVEISKDGGNSWTVLLHYDGQDYPGPRTEIIDLTPYVGSSNTFIRFRYVAPGWHWWWAIDDVIVKVDSSITATTKLLQPNGGQKWKAGYKYKINWEGPIDAYKFNLKYSTNNKASWNNIATVLSNDRCNNDGAKLTCSYVWTIPAQDGRKTQNFVRVEAIDSSNHTMGTDDSDKAFVIEVLRVVSPNGGETLQVGSTYTIKWETYALTKPVNKAILQYSTNGGISWTNITTLTGNPGSYNWIVPNTLSTKGKVRVILKDNLGATIATDASDRVFKIQ
ncbi:MAG: hypothetical protein N2511_07970, partial [Thermodesulfovibrionales bacterium]|nr:hypothetical protein [Thermodesulfovibrionales bacterium]